ncbi:MAG: acyltransferase domain-containing protein, partial [Vicinamibacteria bacterium]
MSLPAESASLAIGLMLASRIGAGIAGASVGTAAAVAPTVAFLFTGQGAQYAGMGRALYASSPAYRDALDECATHLDPLLGESLVALLHDEADAGDAHRLDQTRYTQPALFAVEYALGRLWLSWGVRPAAVLGHSVGEFAAVCLAGGMPLADAARIVDARGRLMQALPEGGVMVSVSAGEARVREALSGLEDRAAIAGLNSPEQTVVSGERAAVAQVVQALSAEGIRTRQLTVSHAFHSPLMQPMVAAFREVVASASLRAPEVPVVSCVTGQPERELFQDPDYWVRQVLEPVRFVDGMAALQARGIDAFVEVGPQPVLVGLGRRCLGADAAAKLWLPSLARGGDDLVTVLDSAAQLHVAGAAFDWRGLRHGRPGRRVALPPYAFDQHSHWVAPAAGAGMAVEPQPMRPAQTAAYAVQWRQDTTRVPASDEGATTGAGTWLVMADAGDVAPAVTAALEARGGRCVILSSTGEATRTTVADALARHAPVRGVLHLRGLDVPEQGDGVDVLAAWRRHALEAALWAVQASAAQATPVPVWCVTRAAVNVPSPATDAATDDGADDPTRVAQATLWGFGRTASLEYPAAWGGLVDLPAGPATAQVVDGLV